MGRIESCPHCGSKELSYCAKDVWFTSEGEWIRSEGIGDVTLYYCEGCRSHGPLGDGSWEKEYVDGNSSDMPALRE